MIALDLAIAAAAVGWCLALAACYLYAAERRDHARNMRRMHWELLEARDVYAHMSPAEKASARLAAQERMRRHL